MTDTLLTANPKYERAILSTLVHIQTHLENTLDLDLLAQRAGFSPFHFHRIFREIIGEPVKAYIRRLRLERAAYRLKISEDRILRIALDAGFKTHETFTRAFIRQFNKTPKDFRKDFLQDSLTRKKQLQPSYFADLNMTDESGLLSNGSTTVKVKIEHVRQITVGFVRHVGPYEALLDEDSPMSVLWEKLFAWGNANHLMDADSLLIGIPQDDPSVTPPDKQRFDICVQVPECNNPTGPIGCQAIPGGLFGVGRHYGGFENLADTYGHIYDTLVTAGKYAMRTGVPFEIYSHANVKGDIRIHFTDVYLPIEKTGQK